MRTKHDGENISLKKITLKEKTTPLKNFNPLKMFQTPENQLNRSEKTLDILKNTSPPADK